MVHIDHIDVLRLVGYVIYVPYVVNNYENKYVVNRYTK